MVEGTSDSPAVANIVATSRFSYSQHQGHLRASGNRPGLLPGASDCVNIPLLRTGEWAKDC